ncbi:MAG: glucose-6-phosphate isomerase, partial [Schleiferiaceae bacterium]|nr:glucose-6-phosphate isomerase [Schleiferiaceae bacterium]
MSFPSVNPTTTAAWKALEAHAVEAKNWHLRDLLSAEADRFERMHVRVGDLLLFDYAKHRVSETTLGLLEQLFAECGAPEALQAQLSGEAINQTE